MNHKSFLDQQRKSPAVSMTKTAAPAPGVFKRFFEGFRHAFKRNWLPFESKAKDVSGKFPEIDKKFFNTIGREYNSPGLAAGAGLMAGKYLPPVAVVSGMLAGIDAGIDLKKKLKDKFMIQPKQQEIFNHLVENDDLLKKAPRNDLEDAFDTMKKITGNGVSTTDKNLVRSFLRQSIAYDGVDYNTAKQIAETESSIGKARGEDSLLGNISRAAGSLATLTD